MGGVMRRVHKIRIDGVAPVPVADACLHSQQRTAESCLPPSHIAAHSELTRVYRTERAMDDVSPRRKGLGLPISLKTRGVWGRTPRTSCAKRAELLSFALHKEEAI
jgi:hypothetical protein